VQKKCWKKISDRLRSVFKRRDFVREDIRSETIRQLETHISDCGRSKISEYDLCTQAYGKQEVRVFLRSLRQIAEGILADLRFENIQYLWSEFKEKSGQHIFGPANGAILLCAR
jgi:hypothetical protein